MDGSTPGAPVLHCRLEFAQTHVHWVSDSIQPSHPLPPTSPVVFNLSQHQGLFWWVASLHQLAKMLELQPLPFQWIYFWRKVLLVYILVKCFAMCVVHNLSEALCEQWGGTLSLFSGKRSIRLTPGPQKALSLKAQLVLSPSICLKSKVSHPLIPQRGSWQMTLGRELLYGNSIHWMMPIIVCATCSTNESIQLC